MATAGQAKPTADELWLKKTFGTDLTKLDQQFQDGGKSRKKFLADLGDFKCWHEANTKLMKELNQERDLTPEQKKALKDADKMRAGAETQAKKGDVAGALQSEMASRSELNIGGQRSATGTSRANPGYRLGAGWIN